MHLRPLLLLILVVITAGMLSTVVRAQQAGYAAKVPVSDTSDAQRNHAFAVALGALLARTAGQQVTAAPGFTDALGNAGNLVQSYQYERAPAGSAQPFVLVMQFDPAAVKLLAGTLHKQLAAAEPATAASSETNARVWVAPIRSAMGFARMLAALRADSQDADAGPVAADANGVMLRVRSPLALPALLAALQADSHFQVAISPHPGADASLRWTP